MHIDWSPIIPDKGRLNSGIMINALERYLQFDTFACPIPYDMIQTLFIPDDLKKLAEEIADYYEKHYDVLSHMQQHKCEEILRAYLCGFIKAPIINDDAWHEAFHKHQLNNRRIYDEMTTIGRVEMLLERHVDADTIAAAVDKYAQKHAPEYFPSMLLDWVVRLARFYHEYQQRLERYGSTERRAILVQFLEGKSEIAW